MAEIKTVLYFPAPNPYPFRIWRHKRW